VHHWCNAAKGTVLTPYGPSRAAGMGSRKN
jgi:hypothetical protein